MAGNFTVLKVRKNLEPALSDQAGPRSQAERSPSAAKELWERDGIAVLAAITQMNASELN